MKDKIEKIAVVGAGTMGNGIAHVFAQNSFSVYLIDSNKPMLDKALITISKNMDRQIKKSLLTQDGKKNALSCISVGTELTDIPKDIDLLIEAVYENLDTKISLFRQLQTLINADCLFASNTSAISITKLARISNPEKFIGMHFMNPVPMMNLVELIRGFETSDETYHRIKELVLQINKVPVCVNDYPGFISNRILMPMINEAIFTLYENVATAEDIDTVMKLGMNHPMGPLTLADFIGLDVCLAIMEVLYEGFNDSKYRPCPLLKKMVAAGKLGKKTNGGFFQYQ